MDLTHLWNTLTPPQQLTPEGLETVKIVLSDPEKTDAFFESGFEITSFLDALLVTDQELFVEALCKPGAVEKLSNAGCAAWVVNRFKKLTDAQVTAIMSVPKAVYHLTAQGQASKILQRLKVLSDDQIVNILSSENAIKGLAKSLETETNNAGQREVFMSILNRLSQDQIITILSSDNAAYEISCLRRDGGSPLGISGASIYYLYHTSNQDAWISHWLDSLDDERWVRALSLENVMRSMCSLRLSLDNTQRFERLSDQQVISVFSAPYAACVISKDYFTARVDRLKNTNDVTKILCAPGATGGVKGEWFLNTLERLSDEQVKTILCVKQAIYEFADSCNNLDERPLKARLLEKINRLSSEQQKEIWSADLLSSIVLKVKANSGEPKPPQP
jgi:hypothetical protein